MALIHSFESAGNILFKYRGQVPVVLFILAIPVIYFTSDIENNTVLLIITMVSVILSVLGFIVRAYAVATTSRGTSGRNTENQVAETLNTTGIYSVVRHPLYLGNYLMWTGITVFTYNIYFFVIVSLFFWLYYERIMFAEERFLEKKFGKDFMDWSLKVPAFIPCFKKYIKNTIPFSCKSVLRREYSGVLATVFGFTFVDVLRYYLLFHKFEWNRISLYVLAVTIIITVVLRTIKHNTKWLCDKNYS
jgi:protein-S-isoprenylcysteine O-methyltransferase Ste14